MPTQSAAPSTRIRGSGTAWPGTGTAPGSSSATAPTIAVPPSTKVMEQNAMIRAIAAAGRPQAAYRRKRTAAPETA